MSQISESNVEVLDIEITPQNYVNFHLVYELFGRKYFKSPMRLINDNMHLLDRDEKELNYDIRTVIIRPYDIEIKTFYNENNRNILKDKINIMISEIFPKYEHYINYSKDSENIFITCACDKNPQSLKCDEINISSKLVRNGKIFKDSLLF